MKTTTNSAQHDPQNPDNCPPKCRECRKASKDEHRGPMVAVVSASPSVKPAWMDVVLACGHTTAVRYIKGGSWAKRTYCPVHACKGAALPPAMVDALAVPVEVSK